MFKRFLQLPESSNLIMMVFALLLIWLVAPYIHIGGQAPFASVGARTWLSSLLIIGYGIKCAFQWVYRYRGESVEKLREGWMICKEKGARVHTLMKQRAQDRYLDMKDRWQNNQQHRQLKKTPWYLVLGSPKSGKKHVIANSGLRFVKPGFYGRQGINLVQQFDHLNWTFADEAVFADAGQYDESNNLVIDRKFIRYLRKQRRSKPLSGIIFTFSLPELILATHQNRRHFLKAFADQIKNLYQLLKTPIPVYVVFTKADLISGFSEFFSDLSKEDLSQVWGVTFPLRDASDAHALNASFQHEYHQLIARLQQRVLWSLDIEKKQQNRNLIYSFPQQMQLFGKPINTFISELFAMLPRHHMLQMRGVYFTSAQQEGQPYDFFLHAIGKRYNLTSDYRMSQENHSESYFIQKLFYDVIFKEHTVLGFSERAQRVKRWFYRTAWVGTPLAVILGTFAFHAAYKTTSIKANYMADNLQQYQMAMKALQPSDANITHTLSALNSLRNAERMYDTDSGWANILFATHSLTSGAHAALNRSLHTLFLPRVAANLETTLSHGQMDTNALYANLKGYLAFSPSEYTDATAIRAPMEILWGQQYLGQPDLVQNLRYYLERASKLDLDQLPLDAPLINRIRLELQQILPQRRAYALLTIKAIASDYPDIAFPSVIGNGFEKVFREKVVGKTVPALYTQLGYAKVFKQNYRSITRQVADDNKEIGLNPSADHTQSYDQITSEMQRDYNQNYLKAWRGNLSNLSIVPFQSYQQAITTLDLLSSDHSPLSKLLSIISDNTAKVDDEHLHVAARYEALNEFSQRGITSSDLAKTVKTFKALEAYFSKINGTADVNQSAFNAAVKYMKGDTDNPIRQLSILAQKAPQPLRGWLQQIADNSWQLVLNGALHYINAAWHSQVLSEYNMAIKGRYPLVPGAQTQLSIASFQHFFAKQGTLNQFFEQYLKPFINTNTQPWTLYTLNGHSLALPTHDLDIFRRMQAIQTMYFAEHPKQPTLQFSVVPVTLDQHDSEVTLKIGSKAILYEHGPQRPVAIHWPLPENVQMTKLILKDFAGHDKVFTQYGAWSLFKLLDATHLYPAPNGNGYLFSMGLDHHNASFKIITDSPIAAFRLSPLKSFYLPTQLGGHKS